jgi:signal transduction histidine kinase
MDLVKSISLNELALLGSSLLLSVMLVYTWRRRNMPASMPILVMLLLRALWLVFKLLELFSLPYETKLIWYYLSAGLLPLIAGSAAAVLIDFKLPGTWLQKRHLLLWLLPSLAASLLILTNPLHGSALYAFRPDEFIRATRSPLMWTFVIYVLGLFSIQSWRLAQLAVRWPVFRWPVVTLIVAWTIGLAIDYAGASNTAVFNRLDANIFGFNFVAVLFVLVVIGMRRLLDTLPIAREVALEYMFDAAAVIDENGRVVYENKIAQALLNSSWSVTAGEESAGKVTLTDLAGRSKLQPVEIVMNTSDGDRQYVVRSSPLEDPRGWQLGTLLIFHDDSDRVRARQLLAEQQRTQAILEERERIAGELHDDLGQVLGYVKLQIQAAQDWIVRDDTSNASQVLTRLLTVTQEAHTDVREYILSARTAVMLERGFLPVVEEYLEGVNRNFGLQTRLCISPNWNEDCVPLHVAVQLLRIIQEAVTNSRKHASPSQIVVDLISTDDHGCIVIQDDGRGFHPDRLTERRGMSFGIDFMTRRAEGIGGQLHVQSAPGEGTRVSVQFPLQRSQV